VFLSIYYSKWSTDLLLSHMEKLFGKLNSCDQRTALSTRPSPTVIHTWNVIMYSVIYWCIVCAGINNYSCTCQTTPRCGRRPSSCRERTAVGTSWGKGFNSTSTSPPHRAGTLASSHRTSGNRWLLTRWDVEKTKPTFVCVCVCVCVFVVFFFAWMFCFYFAFWKLSSKSY
jgi:hypothetical protein